MGFVGYRWQFPEIEPIESPNYDDPDHGYPQKVHHLILGNPKP